MSAPNFDFPEDHVMRRGRLLTSGIIFGLMGCMLCLFPAASVMQLVMFGRIGGSMPAEQSAELESMQKMMFNSAIINILLYGTFSIALLSIAYGSIFLRRWARPLALITSWLTLYLGVVSLFSVFWMRPMLEEMMAMETTTSITATTSTPSSPGPTHSVSTTIGSVSVSPVVVPSSPAGSTPAPTSGPPSGPPPVVSASPGTTPVPPTTTSPPPTVTSTTIMPPGQAKQFVFVIIAVMVSISFVFGILLPGLLIWLNWSKDVRVTLEFCDPKPRWTDRCPIPVLGITVVALLAIVSSLATFFIPWAPFFGKLLLGNPARLLVGVVILILSFIAWSTYRQKFIGWVAAVALVVGGLISVWLSLPNMDYLELYAQMGMPKEMVEESFGEGNPFANLLKPDGPTSLLMLSGFIPIIIYLIWAFRFFRPGKSELPAEKG